MSLLPFTSDEFFDVFADYNRAFWLVAVVLWFASAVALTAAWRHPAASSRGLSYVLAALWIWNAVAYHALLFTRINPAAWLFSGLFAVQAVLFFRAGSRRTVEYFSSPKAARRLGIAFAGYALSYPMINIAVGHEYPATPTFGVPCPTAIMTIGGLLSARGAIPVTLAAIPAFWGFVGGSAAVLLSVPADYVLLGASIVLLTRVMNQRCVSASAK